jgi:YgiT-type zinc finger domain-containing protein
MGAGFLTGKAMICVICKNGKTEPGTTTVTLERKGVTLVFKKTPARICANCGEAYVDEEVSRQILKAAESALKEGVQVDIREFVALPT